MSHTGPGSRRLPQGAALDRPLRGPSCGRAWKPSSSLQRARARRTRPLRDRETATGPGGTALGSGGKPSHPRDAGSRGCTGPSSAQRNPGAWTLGPSATALWSFIVPLYSFCVFKISHRKNVYTKNTITSSYDRYWSPGSLQHLALIPAPTPVFRFNSLLLAPGNSPASLSFQAQLCNLNVFLAYFLQLGVGEGG